MARLSMWTIYDHPTDVPEPFGFVVREWQIGPAGAEPMSEARFAMTLEAARELIPPGLYCLPRQPEDDPVIVEVWI
jgi:hypothetical protein